jgi:enoyl-CoA hydratase/carnithine racemase
MTNAMGTGAERNGLTVTLEAGTSTMTLNRPPRNLLEPAVMDALRVALLEADKDPEVRAIVLKGAGEHFCGGLDVDLMRSTSGGPVAFARPLVALFKVFPLLGTPVLAAVTGDAVAGGYSLVCCADVAIAATGSRIGTFEASIGIWPMLAQVPPLQRLQPRHALENIITGEPFTAERALAVGAVNEVVLPEELDATVKAWVERITRAGQTLAGGRRAFYSLLELPFGEALDDALERFTTQFEGAPK